MPLDPNIPLSVKQPQLPSAADVLQQRASIANMGLERQLRQQQIQQGDVALKEGQRLQAGRALLGSLIQQNTSVDPKTGKPTINHEAVANGLGAKGFSDIGESWLKTASANSKALEDLAEVSRKHDQEKAATLGDLMYESTSESDFTAKLAFAATHGLLDEADASQLEKEEASKGWEGVKSTYQQFSPKWQEQQKQMNALQKIGPEETLTTGARAQAGLPPLATGAQKKEDTQAKSVLLDGKPTELVFHPSKGGIYTLPGSADAIDPKRLGVIPPASVQIQNMTASQWTDDQIDFYAKQVKQDASKMNLIAGLDKTIRARIERRIADLGGNVSKLTSSSRTMKEMATEVLPHIDRIQAEAEELNKLGLLGPISSRWREFVSGKIGAGEFAGGNAETAKLIGRFRADAGLLQTAVMKAHVGARGSSQLLDHFSDLLGAEKADISTFTGELSGFKDWMKDYSKMGDDPAAATGPTDGKEGTVNGVPAVWRANGSQGAGWYKK